MSRAEPPREGGPVRQFAVGFCGGSGIVYGIRLVEVLLAAGHEVHLMATGVALDAARPDLASLFRPEVRERLRIHDRQAVEASPSSGSAGVEAVVLIPCSMGTLARVAHGFSSNLIERSADVAMKEGRRLVVVPRETPLSAIHLRNMLTLAEAGAVVLPAMPGFYHRPTRIEELVDFVVGKVLDRLGLDIAMFERWRTPEGSPEPSGRDVFLEGEDEER
jgi:4-hydroxy-3-polyprenylbenzoate decarboxylase